MTIEYPIEVKVQEMMNSSGANSLVRTYAILDWLGIKDIQVYQDYQIDMHGGSLGYTSFWFRDANLALLTKLTWE